MLSRSVVLILWLATAPALAFAQVTNAPPESDPVTRKVNITGARFLYPLIEKWIDEYKTFNPNVEVSITPRSITDPRQYDILAEVYEHDEAFKKSRVYFNAGRYAVLPVTRTGSPLAAAYGEKGLDAELVKYIFFGDIFAGQENPKLKAIPFMVYTRLQKAGVPREFSRHYGYEQKDLQGIQIAGADGHLLEALLQDSTGVTYLPTPLVFSHETRKPVEGLSILPIDIDNNKKLSDDEKFYGDVDTLIRRLERNDVRDTNAILTPYFHLSVDKENASPEAIDFLTWVSHHGHLHLHAYGFLLAKEKVVNEAFHDFVGQEGQSSTRK